MVLVEGRGHLDIRPKASSYLVMALNLNQVQDPGPSTYNLRYFILRVLNQITMISLFSKLFLLASS